MRIVLAPDKFKGSLTGAGVAAALAEGLREVRPDLDLTLLPVADGGEGTVAAAVSAGYDRRWVTAAGPTGAPLSAPYAMLGPRAVVELAAVCGLDLLPGRRPDPLGASTYGLGQVLAEAIGAGARDIVLGLGGSASTDGGAGMAQALGAVLQDASGAELDRGGGALADLDRIDLEVLRRRLAGVRVTVATDVNVPLLGLDGAAAMFGPQKGATADDIARLEAGLETWSRLVTLAVGRDESRTPGAGAAGGTGFAALALLDATLRSGIELILELVGFADAVRGADLVITGEGSLDAQSLTGKAPLGVTAAARRAGVPVVAVAGRNLLGPEQLRDAGFAGAYSLMALEPDVDRSMARTPKLLRQLGRWIAREWAV
ncbi:MAG: glycerate kinase [Actinomycetes bacterium]